MKLIYRDMKTKQNENLCMNYNRYRSKELAECWASKILKILEKTQFLEHPVVHASCIEYIFTNSFIQVWLFQWENENMTAQKS